MGKGNSKYSLDRLRRHTANLRLLAQKVLRRGAAATFDDSVRTFTERFHALQASPKDLQRNVRLMLHARVFNHIYSAFLLAESGLIGDAAICARAALEVLAADWLVTVRPDMAERYHDNDFPKPVEVRRMLEADGFDSWAKTIRELYSALSEFVHVTRRPEHELSRWSSETDGKLLLGGDHNAASMERVIKMSSDLLRVFVNGPEQP